MKNKKQIIGLIAGIACVALLVVLLLTMCSGGGEPTPTEPSATEATDPAATTAPAEETVEPETEPAAEPTEEAAEAATEPSSSSTSTPGGTSGPGYSSGSGNTSSGTDTGTDTDDSTETKEEITVSDPGSQDNPYTEALASLPDSITTVKIPAGSSVSYHVYHVDGLVLTIEDETATVVYNGDTYKADARGVVTVELAPVTAEAPVPVVLLMGNSGKTDAAYSMGFAEHLGGATNPEILNSIDEIQAALAEGDEDGYHYQWTATDTGILSISVSSVKPKAVGYEVIVTNGDTTVRFSEDAVTDEDGNTTLSIGIEEDDVIAVQVITVPDKAGTYPAAEILLTGSVEVEEIVQTVTVDRIPGTIETELLPGETYMTYEVYGISGTILTIEDPDAFIIYNGVTHGAGDNGIVTVMISDSDPRYPVILQVGNGGAVSEGYTIHIVYPEGSLMNPAALVLGENTAAMKAADADGHYFSWTAPDEGVLTITMPGDMGWVYVINNTTAGLYGDTQWSDSVPLVNPASVNVYRGDVLQINVNTYDPADMWSSPAGDLVFTVAFTATPGTAGNPIAVRGEFPIVTDSIAPGSSVYYDICGASGMILTLEDEDGYIIYNGNTYTADENGVVTLLLPDSDSVILQVGNGGAESESYTISFAYPAGSRMNPAELVIGENAVTMEAADADGYYYGWTAPDNGVLTITMPADSDWLYTISNITADLSSGIQWSNSDPVLNPVAMTVARGDEVLLNVNTYDPANPWTNPAGQLVFTADYLADLGTESNPIAFTGEYPMETVVIEPGAEVYYSVFGAGGKILTIADPDVYVILGGETYTAQEGVLAVDVVTDDPRYPVTIVIGNSGTEAKSYTVDMAIPQGDMMNPAALVMGENTAALKAGDTDGYFFIWTATDDGTLTITMDPEASWIYAISNLTTGFTGDTHWSDDDPRMTSETIEVGIGNEIRVNVNTYDPADMWNSPAGNVTFTADFAAVEDGKSAYSVTVKDYEENPVTGVTVQFLLDGVVVASEPVDASGLARARLDKAAYTVALAEEGYYYEATGAVVNAETPTLELNVTDKTVEEEDYTEWTFAGKTYSGYFVNEGAYYVELTPGTTHYFRYDPELEGKYLITTSDPKAVLSYWGMTSKTMVTVFRETTPPGGMNENSFTVSVNATAVERYTVNLGITSETETSCILMILPVEEGTAVSAAADVFSITVDMPVEPMGTEPATEPTVPAETETEPETAEVEVTKPEEPATEPTEPATEPVAPETEPTEPAAEPDEPVTKPVTKPVTESEMAVEPIADTAEAAVAEVAEEVVAPAETEPATEPTEAQVVEEATEPAAAEG